ncbi:hypothetical protein VPHF86_0293 [Vibrio phage F86]
MVNSTSSVLIKNGLVSIERRYSTSRINRPMLPLLSVK